jgi:RNA polymerase sigma-70 factor (ECF subfamily)
MIAVPFDFDKSDEFLAARARDGARSAFAALVTRYQNSVYRIARRMAHSASDAEEITQETFLHAYRGIASFEGGSKFRTWLFRIAVNQALMFRRSARRHPQQYLEASPYLSALAPVAADGAAPDDRADDLSDRKAVVERVREAIAQLDEAQRAALVLRDLEQLSAEETAAILGTTPEVVRQRAHRARLKLREQLRDLDAFGSAPSNAAVTSGPYRHRTRT